MMRRRWTKAKLPSRSKTNCVNCDGKHRWSSIMSTLSRMSSGREGLGFCRASQGNCPRLDLTRYMTISEQNDMVYELLSSRRRSAKWVSDLMNENLSVREERAKITRLSTFSTFSTPFSCCLLTRRLSFGPFCPVSKPPSPSSSSSSVSPSGQKIRPVHYWTPSALVP